MRTARIGTAIVGVVLIVSAVSGCSSTPSTFTAKVVIDAPLYKAGLGSAYVHQPVGTKCSGGSEDDTSDMSAGTLRIQDQHGKAIQSQVVGDGEVIDPNSQTLEFCRFTVNVSDVPAGSTKYRAVIGSWTSALVSQAHAKTGISMVLNE